MVTGQTFTADPVALGRPATSILDVLPVTTQASDQFAYLRQSVRTNNAAITPEGQVKPTSIYTVTRIEDRLDVVAHLSEAIPRFWIVDNVALEQFLSLELEYGLSLAVQAMVVSDVASGSSFDIDVTRDGGWWMVHIPELGGLTQARFPREVEPMAREYVAVSTGTPIDQVAINWRRCTL